MSDIYVIYYSMTGNTEEMANCVAEGVKEKGLNPIVLDANSAAADLIKEAPVFALGCSACGDEELDDSMESLVTDLSPFLKGKKVGLFGSYSWADGAWMRAWEQRMAESGAEIVTGKGVIAFEAPDDCAKEELKALGTALAEAASQS